MVAPSDQYSLLDWVPEAHGSWSLSVIVKRIPSQMTAGEMGITRIKDAVKIGSTCKMYLISLLLMASMVMLNSYDLCRVRTAALWCVYVEIASCIRLRNSLRKENVGDPKSMANDLFSRNQIPGEFLMKSSSWCMRSWGR
jgi:hypothetical protein